jgi:hypothetical protein
VIELRKLPQKAKLGLAPIGNLVVVVAARNRRADHQQQDLRQGIDHAPSLAIIADPRKVRQKTRKPGFGKGGFHLILQK